MNETTSINERNLKELLDAFEHYFPTDAVYVSDKPFKSFYGDYNWRSRKDFTDFIRRLTGVEIKNEKDLANIKLAQNKLVKLTGETSEEKPIESNEPDKWAREAQEAERQKREAEIEKTKTESQRRVSKFKESRQKIYEKRLSNLTNKKIVVSPTGKLTEISLTPEEKKTIFTLAQSIKQNGYKETQNFIRQKIQESVDKSSADVKQNISPFVVGQAAKDLTKKIEAFAEYKSPEDFPEKFISYNQASPLSALLNPNNTDLKNIISDLETRQDLTKQSQAVAISLESENNVYAALNDPLFGYSKNISSLFYPKQISEFEISENQNKNDGVEIDLGSVYKNGNKVWDAWQKISTQKITVGEIFRDVTVVGGTATETITTTKFALPLLTGSVVGLSATNLIAVQTLSSSALSIPGSQIFQMVVGGSAGQLVQTSALMIGTVDKVFFNAIIPGVKTAMFVGSGITMGGESMLAAGLSIGNSKIALALTTKGINIAATGTFASVLSFLTTPVGAIIFAVGTWAATKVFPWIKKNFKWIFAGGVALAVAPFAGIFAGILAGGIALAAASVAVNGFSLGAAGAAIGGFFMSLGSLLASSIGMPILITLLSFPVMIALILFIINSGAYVVPPTNETFSSNPYIEVTKIASPAGPFKNSELPLSITYTITIKAKKGPLENINISDSCQIISESGSKKCSVPSLSVEGPISPTEDKIITYTQVYSGDEFIDSFVINTVTIRADTSTGGRQEALATNSIKIGEPPEDCPNNAWPIAGNIGLNSITQGPSASGCSHKNLNNAIDIGVSGEIAVAVHSGIVTTGIDSCVGKYVKITSNCGGNIFSTLYGHLGAVSVKNGQRVTLGQTVGIIDNTGSCTSGDHLHFEFQTSTNIPTVQKPYLTRDVPIACCTRTSCNP